MTSRDNIVQAAFNLFSEHPYNGVSIEKIAEDVGIAKATVLYHFKSKYNLAVEALIFGTLKIENEVRANVLNVGDKKERLRVLILEILKTYAKYPKINRFTLELYELSKENKSFIKMIARFYDTTIGLFSDFLEENGIPNPRIRAQLIRASIDGLILHQEFFTDLKKSLNLPEISSELFKLITL